jgi:phage tail-like protein
VWFGANTGLWRLGASQDRDGRESDSTIVTPALLSPDSAPERGWLRAEAAIDLPRGAVLEAQFATTDDPRVADRAAEIAADRTQTAQQKQNAIWTLLNPSPAQTVRFTAASKPDLPLAIPLPPVHDRWLWLRLSLTTPPGTARPRLHELRVLYPDLSIARYLPAIFRDRRGDQTLRSLVGVIETTTQGLDARIRAIGSYLNPATAPGDWLDYLARWVDLPWDDELREDAKRRVLAQAGALLDARGTRAGVALLVRSLVGDGATIRVTDVTVDYAVTAIGGGARQGTALPALLAGGSSRSATLGQKAVIGQMCLSASEADPLALIRPTLAIEIASTGDVRRALDALLERILRQYIPAGVAIRVGWRDKPESAGSDDDSIVLDEDGPRPLGQNSTLGQTTLIGKQGRLDDAGIGVDVTLQ